MDLSNNRITQLSSDLYRLVNLEKLDLSGNLLDTLPLGDISSLEKLTYLDLSNNLFSVLPFRLSCLSLEYLNVAQNLFISSHAFPHLALKAKGTQISLTNSNTKFSPLYSIPTCRLFFLSGTSDCSTYLV